MTTAVRCVDPFAGLWVPVDLSPRLTVRQMVDLLDVSDALRGVLEVYVGGQKVPRQFWSVVRPLERRRSDSSMVLIEFLPPIRGGKKGGGKIFAAIAAIALIGASLFVAGAGLPALGIAKGSLAAKAISGGLAMAASLAMQGLAPPVESPETPDTVGAASVANTFQPNGPIPRIAGDLRVAPPQLTSAWVDSNANHQYANMLLGLAGWTEISEIRVDGVDIADMPDIQWETTPGLENDERISLVGDTRIQDDVNVRLSEWEVQENNENNDFTRIKGTEAQSDPIWHQVESRSDPDTIRFEVLFPAGLADNGSDNTVAVWLRWRFRPAGEDDWVNLPDILVAARTSGQTLRQSVEVRFVDEYPGNVGNSWAKKSSNDVRGFVNLRAALSGSSAFATPSGSGYAQWVWTENDIILYLLKSSYPVDRHQFQFTRSWPFYYKHMNKTTFLLSTADGVSTSNYFGAVTVGGNQGVPNNPRRFADDVVIPYLQSIYEEYPIRNGGLPVAQLYVRAMDRQISQVTCRAKGIVTRYNPATGLWDSEGPSSNPADQFRAIMRSIHNANYVSLDRLDLPELQDWYVFCRDNGYEVNTALTASSVGEALSLICRAGHASPREVPKFGVAIDRPRDNVVGLITQRNAASFRWEKPLPLRPHAIVAAFLDETRDYSTREVVVYDEGYSADGAGGTTAATRFETMPYDGITNEDKVVERAELDLAWMRVRSTVVMCSMDHEYLQYRRGDRVLVEFSGLGRRGWRGRVAGYEGIVQGPGELSEGENLLEIEDLGHADSGPILVSELLLDEDASFGPAGRSLGELPNLLTESNLLQVGGPKGVSVWCRQDGEIYTAEVASHSRGRLILAEPLELPISVDDIAVTGPLSRTARDMIVLDVVPARRMRAELALVDYAGEQVYG